MIRAAALVDTIGLRTSAGRQVRWTDIDQDPCGGSIRFKALFDAPFPEFRRLDLRSRILVVAAEACGLDELTDAERVATALVAGSQFGCLAADQQFEQSLHTPAGIAAKVFPYTLPSTCLGELAIRHRLRGPTLSLSHGPGQDDTALAAARDYLDTGAARAAVVLTGDWAPGRNTRAAALLLRPVSPDTPLFADPTDLAADLLDALSDRLPWTT